VFTKLLLHVDFGLELVDLCAEGGYSRLLCLALTLLHRHAHQIRFVLLLNGIQDCVLIISKELTLSLLFIFIIILVDIFYVLLRLRVRQREIVPEVVIFPTRLLLIFVVVRVGFRVTAVERLLSHLLLEFLISLRLLH